MEDELDNMTQEEYANNSVLNQPALTQTSYPSGHLNENDQSSQNGQTLQQKKFTPYIYQYISLLSSFIIPPLGIVLSLRARKRARYYSQTSVIANIALLISCLLTIILIGIVGFSIYRNYTRNLDIQDSIKSSSGSVGGVKKYSIDEKNSIDVVNEYFNFLKKEDYASAYKLLSPELQKEYINGESDFAKEVTTANLKLIDSWTVNDVMTSGNRITLKGKAKFKGSIPEGNFEFAFYKDNDGSIKMYLWQISPNT